MTEDSAVHAFSGDPSALLFVFLPPMRKEVNCRFVIDPSADFGSVGSIEFPDLVFDLFDIRGLA